MGGRGSASGKTSGKGSKPGEAQSPKQSAPKTPPVNYTEAQEAIMPALTGSEKQVKWAEDIRETALVAADRLVEDAARGESGEWWRMSGSEDRSVSLQSAQEVRQQVIAAFNGLSSAKQIIDNRTNLSANAVLRIAKALDRQNGRQFKKPPKDAKPTAENKVGVYAKPKKK